MHFFPNKKKMQNEIVNIFFEKLISMNCRNKNMLEFLGLFEDIFKKFMKPVNNDVLRDSYINAIKDDLSKLTKVLNVELIYDSLFQIFIKIHLSQNGKLRDWNVTLDSHILNISGYVTKFLKRDDVVTNFITSSSNNISLTNVEYDLNALKLSCSLFTPIDDVNIDFNVIYDHYNYFINNGIIGSYFANPYSYSLLFDDNVLNGTYLFTKYGTLYNDNCIIYKEMGIVKVCTYIILRYKNTLCFDDLTVLEFDDFINDKINNNKIKIILSSLQQQNSNDRDVMELIKLSRHDIDDSRISRKEYNSFHDLLKLNAHIFKYPYYKGLKLRDTRVAINIENNNIFINHLEYLNDIKNNVDVHVNNLFMEYNDLCEQKKLLLKFYVNVISPKYLKTLLSDIKFPDCDILYILKIMGDKFRSLGDCFKNFIDIIVIITLLNDILYLLISLKNYIITHKKFISKDEFLNLLENCDDVDKNSFEKKISFIMDYDYLFYPFLFSNNKIHVASVIRFISTFNNKLKHHKYNNVMDLENNFDVSFKSIMESSKLSLTLQNYNIIQNKPINIHLAFILLHQKKAGTFMIADCGGDNDINGCFVYVNNMNIINIAPFIVGSKGVVIFMPLKSEYSALPNIRLTPKTQIENYKSYLYTSLIDILVSNINTFIFPYYETIHDNGRILSYQFNLHFDSINLSFKRIKKMSDSITINLSDVNVENNVQNNNMHKCVFFAIDNVNLYVDKIKHNNKLNDEWLLVLFNNFVMSLKIYEKTVGYNNEDDMLPILIYIYFHFTNIHSYCFDTQDQFISYSKIGIDLVKMIVKTNIIHFFFIGNNNHECLHINMFKPIVLLFIPLEFIKTTQNLELLLKSGIIIKFITNLEYMQKAGWIGKSLIHPVIANLTMTNVLNGSFFFTNFTTHNNENINCIIFKHNGKIKMALYYIFRTSYRLLFPKSIDITKFCSNFNTQTNLNQKIFSLKKGDTINIMGYDFECDEHGSKFEMMINNNTNIFTSPLFK